MKHPSPDALLELHFDESAGLEREAVAAHVRQCPSCGAVLDEVRRLEGALVLGPEDAPPADGLERVLARVAEIRPVRARGEWARAVVPGAAALVTGWWAIRVLADWLASSGLVPGALAGSVAGDLLGLSVASVSVVCVGAVVTLALAPVLILESHGRS